MQKKHHSIPSAPVMPIDLLEEEFSTSEAQQAELAELYNSSTDHFELGKVIAGKIVSVDGDGVLVNINYKSDGLIPNYEFSDYDLKKVTLGSSIEVVIDRFEDEHGNVVLSYQKAKSLRAWDRITALADKDEPVVGIVTHKVKGGLSVDIGIPAFLPGSQVDIQRVNDFDQFVNHEVTCKILKINRKRGNVILSRRKYLEEQRLEDKRHALETLQEGQIVAGVVKNITNYGAFVDIGGIDGLLHITDMSWGRIAHPSEMLRIGDTVSVKILSLDRQHEKISLGMKQLTPNPWEQVAERYQVGSTVTGNISSITDYGLFVEVEKGVEGLVHISEISWTERINNLSRHFQVGQEVKALVVALDRENRRMSLSIKQLCEDPWKQVAQKFKEGDRVSGSVSNVTDFGVFVRLDEGVDGLVHVSDLSWTGHVKHPGERFKKGDTVEAVVLGIDPQSRKISLGIKQLDQDPWESVEERYPVGSTVEGTVSQITNFGAFIRLSSGIEGLVHISELAGKEVSRVEDILKLGQSERFKVIKVNREERKLGLSYKALHQPAGASSSTTSEYTGSSERRERSSSGSSGEFGSERSFSGERSFTGERRGGERTDRGDRGFGGGERRERRDRNDRGGDTHHAKGSTSSLKNSLQQALEEHAARGGGRHQDDNE